MAGFSTMTASPPNWAPATSEINGDGYGRFLSFLAETGELDLSVSPAERITRPRVETYIGHLRERNHSSTVAARIHSSSRQPG
jgi:hypothetical protein